MSAQVDILSDSDSDADVDSAPPPPPLPLPSAPAPQSRNAPPPPSPILLLDDDDPTPIKPRPTTFNPSSLVALSPLLSSPDVAIVASSLARRKASHSSPKFRGRSAMILVESDDESDSERCKGVDHKAIGSSPEIGSSSDLDKNCSSELFGRSNAKYESISRSISSSQSDECHGEDDKSQSDGPLDDDLTTKISFDTNEERSLTQKEIKWKRKSASDGKDSNAQAAARKRQLKEEKAQLVKERKRKREEEKLEREALKAEAQEMRKLEKEKRKWEKGKLALQSIVAEIDSNVIQDGKLGGHLLTRFAEKGFSYRITKNPIEGSIVWKMDIPDEVAQHSSVGPEVPYVVVVCQAKDFCDLIRNNLLVGHVHKVRSRYPSFIICYATNNLMSYIKRWKKLTWLSVNANGSIVPKSAVEKNLIKKNTWLKALVAIPKVQPRHAIAIWKKYPTMRSLLNVYMDPARSVHEKEFILKDLVMEGILGNGERRLGEICSKRVYRILMAQSGGMKTGDVEDGADFFG